MAVTLNKLRTFCTCIKTLVVKVCLFMNLFQDECSKEKSNKKTHEKIEMNMARAKNMYLFHNLK